MASTGRDARRRSALLAKVAQADVGPAGVRAGSFCAPKTSSASRKRCRSMRTELLARLDEIDVDIRGAVGVGRRDSRRDRCRASLADMERRYGVNLDANSHGQSFLKLFQSRFVPGGLYLLDEPEAPLSPQSQLALIAMIGDMISAGRAVHHRDALADSARLSRCDDLLVRPGADRARGVRGAGSRRDHARFPERARSGF